MENYTEITFDMLIVQVQNERRKIEIGLKWCASRARACICDLNTHPRLDYHRSCANSISTVCFANLPFACESSLRPHPIQFVFAKLNHAVPYAHCTRQFIMFNVHEMDCHELNDETKEGKKRMKKKNRSLRMPLECASASVQ